MNTSSHPSLEDLQKWMRWIITDPRGVQSALNEKPAHGISNPERYQAPSIDCRDFIQNSPPITRPDRLNIYAEAYFSRLLESLSVDFESILKVIGEDAFMKLSADYLKAHPSSETNIGEVGKNFESFLRSHEFSKEVQFLPELAGLEWAVIQAFYADDLPVLDVSALGEVPGEAWPNARFTLDPSVFLLETNWPVHELWRAETAYDLDASPCSLLIYRSGGAVRVETLDPFPFHCLKWMSEGLTLAQICENLSEKQQDLPPLMEWFQNWIALGIIRGIEIAQN